VRARLIGETRDPVRHLWKLIVKAITYHQIQGEPNARWESTVLVDVLTGPDLGYYSKVPERLGHSVLDPPVYWNLHLPSRGRFPIANGTNVVYST
jgi:Archease protein family (MTH1598/TM1083)